MSWQTPSWDSLYAIGEVCETTGLSARTVRYYEELGLLPGVRRRAGGRRVYGPDELERLRFIQRLKALGLSLADVKELNVVYAIAGSTRAMLERLDEQLGRHVEEVDGLEELPPLAAREGIRGIVKRSLAEIYESRGDGEAAARYRDGPAAGGNVLSNFH